MAEAARPDTELAIHIAQFHLSRRRPDDARAALQTVVAAPPEATHERQKLADALAALALAYASRRKLDDAANALAAARALASDSPAVWRAVATLETAHGNAAAAQSAWRHVATAEPGNVTAWQGLARASEAAGDADGAVAAYLRATQADPEYSTILTIAERVAALAPARSDVPANQQVRIALLGSSTLDHLRSYLEVTCRQAGLTPDVYVAPFGQYAQEILNPASELYAFDPEVVVLAVHGQALFPELYNAPFDLDPADRRAQATQVVEHVVSLATRLTARTNALVLLHTFGVPQYSPAGILDSRDEFGQTALFQAINGEVAARVRRDLPSVHLIDEDRVFGRIGKRNVTDPRLWYTARIGFGAAALGALAAEYLRFIRPLKGKARKCLVLDLDNTLWGGVVGEDGPAGIALGNEAPGNAYVAFQQTILSLWKRGVILAINSKNNESDAMEVLERHPEMVLRPSHFAALRINWQDKATNLRSIADELNIGLDSLVFVDDNPAECALVRARLPEVLTVELPPDPASYRSILLELTDFETLALTAEDRDRGRLYAERRQRQEWEAGHSGSGEALGDYLTDLGLVVEVMPADEFAIPRIAQLLGKTNQFNLTTRRHNEATVRTFAASPDARVYSTRVRDRFGDSGLVGAAILTRADGGAAWMVDSLVLSCRVLGRGVETTLLSALVSAARAAGAHCLRGEFLPTAKNAPARDFYRRHAFTLVSEREGAQVWERNVDDDGGVAVPEWLTLHVHAESPVRVP